MNPETLNNLYDIAASIAFKKYLLSCDVDSRNVVLLSCISALDNPDQVEKKCIAWLQNIADINAKIGDERKEEIRKDGRWDELHYELVKCKRFRLLMRAFCL